MSGDYMGGFPEPTPSRFLTLDIETAPQARYVDPASYNSTVDGALEMEQDWLAEHPNDEEVAMAIGLGEAPLAATHVVPALHATTCHIVQVSFGWRQGNDLKTEIYQHDEPPARVVEQDVVAKALSMIASATAKGTRIVSFNGKLFDVPVLRARAALLGVALSGRINWRRLLYPYSDNEHADLRLILSADDRRAWGTLQWWAEAFGVHAEEHGKDVAGWVRDGNWACLRSYGETEAHTLVNLFERVERIL